MRKGVIPNIPEGLICDIRSLIEQSHTYVARTINSTQVQLFWDVGKRLKLEILKSKRAKYGEQIVSTLSRQLMAEFGRGFSAQNIHRMVQCYSLFLIRKKCRHYQHN